MRNAFTPSLLRYNAFSITFYLLLLVRIDIEKIISSLQKSSSVNFVGRPSLADRITKVCAKYDITLSKDFTNSQRGQSDKKIRISYIKKTLSVIVLTLGACVLLSVYINIRKG